MPDFLAEVFSPADDESGRRELIQRAAARRTDGGARYIRSIYLPLDEILLLVFQAASSEEVAQLADGAELRVARIADATLDP